MDEVQRQPPSGQSTSVDDTPVWNKVAAAIVVVALIAAVVIFRHRIGADFWPLDASRVGPNLVASVVTWAAIFTATVLLYPPWRRRLHRFIDAKLNPLHEKLDRHHASVMELHAKVDSLHEKHDELLRSHAELHSKLDRLQNGNE